MGDDNAINLFNHQMIPHHQNAVNMCKSLLFSGEADCEDLEDEESPACVLNVICQEIINVQNAQIQTMRGILTAEGYDDTDDCEIAIASSLSCKKCKKKARKYRGFNPDENKCINKCRKDSDMEHAGCDRQCCKRICRADGAQEGCKKTGFCEKNEPPTSAPTPAPTGLDGCGCYQVGELCNCSPEQCNQTACEALTYTFPFPPFQESNKIWTGGCSCQCPGLVSGVDCPARQEGP